MPDSDRKIRILVVDDHPVLREGISSLISNQSDMEVVAEASTGREAVELYLRYQPAVTLMDLQMPDMGGLNSISQILGHEPQARIIVLTTFAGDALARNALKAGAYAYILKSMVRKELLETIRSVNRGFKRVQAEVATEIANHIGDPLLSRREKEVLTLASRGYSNKQIAASLNITNETAKGYMKGILARLGASDRTHAVTIALRRGIIDLN